METPLEFRALHPDLTERLGDFLESVESSGDSIYFHPHPMTRQAAHERCHYQGADIYVAAVHKGKVLAYGLLRGWDEGYSVPSLGIAVAHSARGTGLARAFMLYLHSVARLRGANQVRLTVFRSNAKAITLYRNLGYRFRPKNADEEIGLLDLHPVRP